MKKFYCFTLIAAGLVILSSCCACRSGKSSTGSLTANTWQIVELQGEPITITDADTGKYTLTFGTDNRISGLAECNRFFGGYEAKEGNKLEITGAGSTRMACLNENFENQYLQMLDQVDAYRFEGRYLILTDANDYVIAMFKKVQ
ncbi:MAG: META domain-containing protein [Rikenellaceae bacterium]|nr:META domain-containing protein [Rikenellaceae bacterium]